MKMLCFRLVIIATAVALFSGGCASQPGQTTGSQSAVTAASPPPQNVGGMNQMRGRY